MIVFTLTLLICASADSCRWHTVAHLVRESLCHEIGREYLTDPTVQRYIGMRSTLERDRVDPNKLN